MLVKQIPYRKQVVAQGRFPSPHHGSLIRRHRKRGQDPHDRDDGHELDNREAVRLLTLQLTSGETSCHPTRVPDSESKDHRHRFHTTSVHPADHYSTAGASRPCRSSDRRESFSDNVGRSYLATLLLGCSASLRVEHQ